MTAKEEQIINRINEYAEEVLGDIDPQKTLVSLQLEKLRPVMEQIAEEENRDLSDIFILYMDLASEQAVLRQKKFDEKMVQDFSNPSDTYDFPVS